MIDISQYYNSESEYLKASDLTPGKKFSLTIKAISVTDFDNNGKKESKPTLAFNETDKKLSLNKTNAMTIAHVLGNDAEQWVGSKLYVYSARVNFGDKLVDAVRVDMPLEVASMAPAPRQPDPVPAAIDDGNFDDDIPF